MNEFEKNNKKISIYYKQILIYLALFIFIIFPIFGHLEALTIRIWDEARLAINAYEMFKNGNFMVTHYEGNPDLWNTKPPLLIWLQVIGMNIFGPNELAIRLPSALAAFITCIALLVFLKKYFKNNWFGIITVLVLVTSQGYISIHGTRTGDYDALLTLFTTMSGLLFFTYCHKKQTKYLYLFFFVTAFAVLTKSVTGLFFAPALVLFSIIDKQFLSLLKNKHFYLGILVFILIVAAYYIPREIISPGYLQAVQENELGGRYLTALEDHNEGFWFYLNNLINYQYSYWIILVPVGLLVALTSKNQLKKKLGIFTLLMIVVFFLIISTAKTKLVWYDIPLYPFMAISVAFFIHFIIETLESKQILKKPLKFNLLPITFFILVLIYPYNEIFRKTNKQQEIDWAFDIFRVSNYLRDATKGKIEVSNEVIVLSHDTYNGHIKFYVNILNDEGKNITFKLAENLETNDVVLVYQDEIKQQIEKTYDVELLEIYHNISKYKINDKQN